MSHHSTAFEVERPVQPRRRQGSAAGSDAPAVIRKFNFRKAVNGRRRQSQCLPARRGMAGTIGRSASIWSRRDDASCESRQHDGRAQNLGYLHEGLVGDNERVKAGQVLARIDQRDFRWRSTRPRRRRRNARCDRQQAGRNFRFSRRLIDAQRRP